MKSKARQPRAPQIPPALAAKSRRAIELHQQGQLAEAERLYRQILAEMPKHFDSLHLLGVIKGQQNEFAAAVPFFEQALRVNPDSASAFNNFGNVLQALGRHTQALASYDRSLALRPDNPKALMQRGNVLRKLKRPDEALDSYDRALRLQPGYADALTHRGGALTDLGRRDEAVAAYRQALASGGDSQRIMYSLACLGAEATPKASPIEYVKGLFDQYADAFDEHLVETLEYKTPALLVDVIRALVTPTAGPLDALDLGCGTGLCGPLLRPLARTLVGVDLSPRMLAKARERGDYDELVCAELSAYLAAQPPRFDVAVAADVFVYIGDLAEVFARMRAVLRPGGVFGFSVEAGGEADFVLQPTHRYAHSLGYLRGLAEVHRFAIESVESRVIRKNLDTDVSGHLVVMRREPAIATARNRGRCSLSVRSAVSRTGRDSATTFCQASLSIDRGVTFACSRRERDFAGPISQRKADSDSMATIEKDRKLMTLVNVFTVSPDKQAGLARAAGWRDPGDDAALARFRIGQHPPQPGWHESDQLLAQRRSRGRFAAMRDILQARPHMQAAAALASFEPIVCEVVDSVATE